MALVPKPKFTARQTSAKRSANYDFVALFFCPATFFGADFFALGLTVPVAVDVPDMPSISAGLPFSATLTMMWQSRR